MNGLQRAQSDPARLNHPATLPYELRQADFMLALQDLYDLLFDINAALLSRGLRLLKETVRPAVFAGIISDTIAAALAKRSRVLRARGRCWYDAVDDGGSQRYRFVMGSLRSRPKARGVTLTPGGACRRLYSARSTRAATRRTVSSG